MQITLIQSQKWRQTLCRCAWRAASAPTATPASASTPAANKQELSAWTRLDIGANYVARIMDRNVTFRARIDNVTDKSYWASAGGYPNANYLILGAPRTASGSASVDF
ncbi:hypothetical protein [Duganella sp. BuS-21]|uniref:hypothetical protein n=1 Tax=Duganella sp. BuS-21 TaxID=2943848 RepID=UPI0035A69170